MNLKKIGKNLICKLLESQVKRLLRTNQLIVVAVGGSIGKTSTKLAIARTLEASSRVIYQDGNYNDRLTVPLVLFNKSEPAIFNVLKWAMVLFSNERTIRRDYPYEIAVLEIGTDGTGQLKDFAYLNPDLYVLTAIAEEHMEYFGDLDAVAQEELYPVLVSKSSLINLNNVDPKYLPEENFSSYGDSNEADYQIVRTRSLGVKGQELSIKLKGETDPLKVETSLLGKQGAMILLASVSVNHMLGKSAEDIKMSIDNLIPVPGRMQLLEGLNDSVIIDDTYNASPVAVKAALDVLYSLQAEHKIAVLGSMNELGETSKNLHEQVGAYCNPKELKQVITIGKEAKKYLAPAAEKAGCKVISFLSPHEAGKYLAGIIKPNTVVLAKGSQNGVFAEEAIKPVLKDQLDQKRLVRQSKYWLQVKASQFK